MTRGARRRSPRKLLLGAAALAGVYLLALLAGGVLLEGWIEDRVTRRLQASMDAEVVIDDASLDLLGGTLVLRGVHIERRRAGEIRIDIDRIDVGLASFGRAVYDRDLRTLAVRGVDISISGPGALDLRGERDRDPLRVDALVLEDVRVLLMPTALAPGLGRIELEVPRARTSGFLLANGLSWVFALVEVSAVVTAPGGTTAEVRFADEHITVGAGLLGAQGITVPFQLPRPDPDQLEIDQLKALARQLARALGAQAARSWLEDAVRQKLQQRRGGE